MGALLRPSAGGALAASIVAVGLMVGARSSFAAFIRPIEADLRLDRATLATAGALTLLAAGLALPLVGQLTARFGPRRVMLVAVALMALAGFAIGNATAAWQLYLWAGVVPGVAFAGSSSVPAAVLLARWFDRRQGLATGLMSGATPAGQAAFVPLAAALIPLLGWRATYIVMGLAVALVALPVLWVWAREPRVADAGRAAGGVRTAAAGQSGGGAHLALPRRVQADLWLVGAGYFACGFTDQFVGLHFVALASDSGMDPLAAAGVLSGLLVVAIFGSVASGRLADVMAPGWILAGLYLTRAATLPLLLAIGSPLRALVLALFALLFGATYIANQAPGARLVRDRYGVERLGPLMGAVGLAHQVGGAAGIAMGGLSVSLAGWYGPAILLAAAVALAGGLLQLGIPRGRAAYPS